MKKKKKYFGWKGSFVCHYFNHLEEGEWIEISWFKYWSLKMQGYTVKIIKTQSKMTNVEKLTRLGIIGHVRQRLGADDANDTRRDDLINKMNNSKLVEQWAGWYLGDGSWWTTMKGYYDELEKLSK